MTAGKGTHGYMAPEAYEAEYGTSADIFSLGATLFEVANLKKAYTGTGIQIMKKLVIKQSGPEEFAEHCPQEIRPLLTKCLTLDHENRPDIHEVISGLDEIKKDKDFVISRLTKELAEANLK